MNMEENSLLWEHCEDPYHINDYTMKYTDYEYLINYKDNEYYVDVTYTIEILQIDLLLQILLYYFFVFSFQGIIPLFSAQHATI